MKLFLIGIFAFALTVHGSMGTSHATVVSGTMSADNSFTFYINTIDGEAGATTVGSGNNILQAYTLTSGALTPGVVNYLLISAYNFDGPAGFKGSFTLSDNAFTFADGTPSLLTNTSNWTVSKTGFGQGPVPASLGTDFYVAGANVASPIWSNDQSAGQTAFLSAQIIPTPEPSTYLLLCLSLSAVGFMRRQLRQKNS